MFPSYIYGGIDTRFLAIWGDVIFENEMMFESGMREFEKDIQKGWN